MSELVSPRRVGEWVAIQIHATLGTQRGSTCDANATLPRRRARVRRCARRCVAAVRAHIERVEHALAVLHLCTYEATGATVASPTTSVPEAPGFDRQFDYRYAWIRDNALASSVASLVGRPDVASRSLHFSIGGLDSVFHAPLFAVDGDDVPDERNVIGIYEHDGSARYASATRRRNSFSTTHSGSSTKRSRCSYKTVDGSMMTLWRLATSIADRICDADDEPTNGIWEQRRRQQMISADIGRWIALDRAIWLARFVKPRWPAPAMERSATRGPQPSADGSSGPMAGFLVHTAVHPTT